ncbi:MAG: histidine kinase dimerization/phospho-acceptor domain-containing protein [Rickettsiales bacterium]
MKNSWLHPSLSRDFALLSMAVLLVLALVSGWVTYKTYERHYDEITIKIGKDAALIESILSNEIGRANYMLASLGRQIIIEPDRNYTKLAQSLKSFDSKNNIYSIFSWVDINKYLVVSSNKGVLEEPVDISDRDFMQYSYSDSWKMHIGRPIEGRVSNRWVIPMAMGVTDYTGKFIGTLSLSMDIDVLTKHISSMVQREGISFAIINKNLSPLSEVSEHKNFIANNFPPSVFENIDFEKNISGLLSKGNLMFGIGTYTYYRSVENYPYVILMGYDASYSDSAVRTILWSRLLQIFVIAIFFVFFLWIVRVRVISPVLDMTSLIASIIRGERFNPLPKRSSIEMESLLAQVQQVSKYIDETVRIENELRGKMFQMKKDKENAEFNTRSKSEFLAYIAQDLRMPINNIIGFSQVLKDQVYGSLENRKYKQYASDIYNIANQIMDKIQNILLYSKIENGYLSIKEESFDIKAAINTSLRQLSDKLEFHKTSVKLASNDLSFALKADEFRFQQIVINILLFMLDDIAENSVINIEIRAVTEYRNQQFLSIVISNGEDKQFSAKELTDIAEKRFSTLEKEKKLISSFSYIQNQNNEEHIILNNDLRIELVKLLVAIHDSAFYMHQDNDRRYCIILFFPFSKIDTEY